MQSPTEIVQSPDVNPFANGLISESSHIALASEKLARRAEPETWVEVYLDALSRGHTKTSAQGVARISNRTAYALAQRDPEFAEKEEIAYHQGTARLYGIAVDRVTDPVNPSDNVLKHLLGVRGVAPKNQLEISGSINVGKAEQAAQAIDLEQLPVYAKRLMLICLNGGELSSDLQKLMNKEMTQLELQIAEKQMREHENKQNENLPIEAMKVISK